MLPSVRGKEITREYLGSIKPLSLFGRNFMPKPSRLDLQIALCIQEQMAHRAHQHVLFDRVR